MTPSSNVWQNPQFRLYLNSTAYTGIAFAMQQLLLSWILIGTLELPATQVGVIQAAAGVPGIFLMLLGGARADGRDLRSMLIQIYSFAPVLPVLLIAVVSFDALNVWSVLIWAIGMSVVISYSSPAQQALLSNVAATTVQKAVSATTAVGFLVQMLGLCVAGTMDKLGLLPVLGVQALCIVLGALAVRQLPTQTSKPIGNTDPAWKTIAAGLQAAYQNKVVFHVLGINFASSIFNAGAFMTVFPFIIKRVYEGDAFLLSIMMIIFYGGAAASNFFMMRAMPLQQPGKIYLIMQLSRILILGVMWMQPPFWMMAVASIAWGLNMGVTMTLARAIVQESASEEFRGRIMSVYSLGLLGSAPLGAILLGWIIESFGTVNALLPAMVLSLLLFLFGLLFTSIYQYQSPK